MRPAAQNDRMSPIAFIASQQQLRRTLVGALATDPVAPDARSQTTRRVTGTRSPEEIRRLAPQAARCTPSTRASVC
jgi:hypothetical protein